jgi:Amt family ammonium transporter
MTWHPDGILFKLGVLDFAGGTVVHMSAGLAALAGAMFMDKELKANVRMSIQIFPTLLLVLVVMVWLVWF